MTVYLPLINTTRVAHDVLNDAAVPMVKTPFTHLEQATGEDKDVAKNRMQLYTQKAKHARCMTKSGKRTSDGGGSSGFAGSLRALLAKRAKEPEQ